MNFNWLQSAAMGLSLGLSELLPLSSDAARGLMRHCFGGGNEGPLYALLTHAAVLAVVVAMGDLELNRLRRTQKILKTPPKRRTGHPDLNSAGTLKLLRIAGLLAILGRLISGSFASGTDRLYLLAPMLLVTGVILWLPSHHRTANKDGRHLTPADGLIIGLGALFAAVPGISLVAVCASLAILRGADLRYAIRFSWLLLTLELLAAIGLDCLALVGAGFSFGLSQIIGALVGAACAALGAFLAVQLTRTLIRRGGVGIGGFCYINWGTALLCLMLFLLV